MKLYRPRRLHKESKAVREPDLYRSICINITSIVVSLVMLVGTTFAWFSESITTGVSTITAGSVHAVTKYCTELPTGESTPNWQYVSTSTSLFGAKLNKGASQSVYLMLENKSENAIEYRFYFHDGVSTQVLNAEKNLGDYLTLSCGTADAVGNGFTLCNVTSSDGEDNNATDIEVTECTKNGKHFSVQIEAGKTKFVELKLTLADRTPADLGDNGIDLRLKIDITQVNGETNDETGMSVNASAVLNEGTTQPTQPTTPETNTNDTNTGDTDTNDTNNTGDNNTGDTNNPGETDETGTPGETGETNPTGDTGATEAESSTDPAPAAADPTPAE